MILDMRALVRRFTTGTYSLTRRPAATIDADGRATQATAVVEVIKAAVFPEPSLADDEQRAPAGAWSTDRLMVFAEGLSAPLTASTDTERGDRITYQGKVYEVSDSLDWTEAGGFAQARFGIVDTRIES